MCTYKYTYTIFDAKEYSKNAKAENLGDRLNVWWKISGKKSNYIFIFVIVLYFAK